MDSRTRDLCSQLRAMRSDEAASWLMETYKVSDERYGEAFTLIPHRSWAKADQLRLARYYLQNMPFASDRPYQVFATFMPVRTLVAVMREHLPNVARDRIGLLHYYVSPLIQKKAQTEEDMRASS